jgi:cytochrome c556
MKSILFVCLAALLLTRCAPSETARVEAAETELMAQHDSLMTRMGDLLKAKKQLRQRMARLDSLAGSPTETVRADEQKAEAQRLYARVDEAETGMMTWMENYKADALRYLAGEKTKINDVNVRINTSLRQSRTFLDQ